MSKLVEEILETKICHAVVQQGTPLVTGAYEIRKFDREALIKAICDLGANGECYTEEYPAAEI